MRLVWILLVALFIIYYRRIFQILYTRVRIEKTQPKIEQFENSSKKALVPAWYSQEIPFKIHQTSFSRKIRYELSSIALANHYVNSEYDYFFYDDADCVEFISKNYPQYMKHYDSLIPGAYKADLFRLLVLHHSGGVYIDDKTRCVRPLRELLDPTDTFYIPIDPLPGLLYQGVLCSTPGHPLIKKCIDQYIQNIEKKSYGEDMYDIGGPRMVGRVVNKWFGREENSAFTPIKEDGIHIEGGMKNNLIVAGSKVFFERSDKSYLTRRIPQILCGKEYVSAWCMGKVYR
jgi:mannosyltransferase OCH1-like enzyme